MIPSGCGDPAWLAEAPPALLEVDTASRSAVADDALTIAADRLEVDLDGEFLVASGSVIVTFRDYRLRAANLVLDGTSGKGRAAGGVRLQARNYLLESDHVEFDARNEQATAGKWEGIVPGNGRFSGGYLFLSPAYAFAAGARYSPCLADDPGYYLSSERFEWFPFGGKQHFEGEEVTVHLSGAAVARLPSVKTTTEAVEEQQQQPSAVDTQVGYNAYDGAYATGTGKFRLADGHQGTIPVRVTQGRGLLVGTTQAYSWGRWSLSGDASYQTRFQGGTAGPRINVGATTSLPRGPKIDLGLGYRTDLAGQAVHRFPEVGLSFPFVPVGPFTLSASTRAGYLMENYPDPAAPPPEALNPFSQQTEKIGVRAGALWHRLGMSPPAWRPHEFWESQVYSAGTVATYVERGEAGEWSKRPRHQVVGTVGVSNTQHWSPFLSTQVGLEANRTDGLSPFLHDRTYPTDQVSGGITVHPLPRWSLSAATIYSRPPDQQPFRLAELKFRLGYTGPCLSWGLAMQILSFEPFSPAISLDYQVGTF